MGAVQLSDVIATSGAALETTSQTIVSKVDVVDGNVDDIETKTGTIESKIDTIDGNVDDIETAVGVIDGKADTISGYAQDAALDSEIVETHFHSNQHAFGLAASPSGETHRADLCDQVAPFVLTTGNNAYGSWVQVIGSSDTPIESGKGFFDLSEIHIVGTNDNAVYTLQFATGESAGLAAKVTAKDYTGRTFKRDSNQVTGSIEHLGMKRLAAGTKVWARATAVGVNGKTISFYLNGIHEYPTVGA